MRILMIEDNRELAEFFVAHLEDQGFVVDHFTTLRDADASVAVVPYDAILADRMLPDGDGLDWIRAQKRAGSTVPILILTAECDSVDCCVEGLNAGADDYMVKPMQPVELVARIRAVLRRPPVAFGAVLQAGNVTFDPGSRDMRVAGKPLCVPRRETCIFEMLVRRLGKPVTKGALEEGLYSFEDEVSSNAIEVGIYRLRGYLSGVGATATIRTIRGTGYVLEAPAVPEAAPAVPQEALVAAQVAIALVNGGAGAPPILPTLAVSLSQSTPEQTRVAAIAAAIAVSLTGRGPVRGWSKTYAKPGDRCGRGAFLRPA